MAAIDQVERMLGVLNVGDVHLDHGLWVEQIGAQVIQIRKLHLKRALTRDHYTNRFN